MIRDTRKNYAEKPLHPDTELHILAFDVIFCSTVYNLSLIHISEPTRPY